MAEQRQTTKVVLVVVLAVALASVLILRTGVLKFGSRRGDAGTGTQGKAGQTTTGDTKNGASGPEVQWKRPDAVGPVVSDPMRMDLSKKKAATGKTVAPPTEPEFLVAGIIYSTQQPSSIIVDGRILHEGDTIYGATVTKITETYAELKRGDKTWQIKAGQSNKEPR
jgi:hypothetical protein